MSVGRNAAQDEYSRVTYQKYGNGRSEATSIHSTTFFSSYMVQCAGCFNAPSYNTGDDDDRIQ